MGTYLSKPITEKVSEDGKKNFLSYGSSAMQGWRIYQEDAHNTILDYGDQKSFFAVYDGHGGHEVAAYTAENYPTILKTSETFVKEDFTNALKQTFLSFDETLVNPDIQLTLKEIAKLKDDDSDSEDEKEEVDHLYREANMPLAEVMEQYSKLKAKTLSKGPKTSVAGISDNLDEPGASGSGISCRKVNDVLASSSSSSSSTNADINEAQSSDANVSIEKNIKKETLQNGNVDEPKENITKCLPILNGDVKAESANVIPSSSIEIKDSENKVKIEDNVVKNEHKNGVEMKQESTNDNIVKDESNGTPNGSSPKGNSKFKGKGKSSTKRANLLVKDESSTEKADKRLIQKRKAAEKAEMIYKQIQIKELPDDDDEEDEEDLDEEIEEEEDDDDSEDLESEEEMNEDEMNEDDDDEENETSESDEEEEVDEELDDDATTYSDFAMNMREEPGYDSGCTACVVLVHDYTLTVANVGDSRCVVCRDGKAVDMSIDHKPEDKEETDRIVKAGGKITRDKRVNGGLNLSRAIGDHSYKQNKSMKPEEQMISPMPDVKTLELDPKDSFMIIACDGIWNSLSSQEACEFVSCRLKPDTKLSSICEEMFDHCLAPNVFGDGTGCDNMTCIIVKFDHSQRGAQKRDLKELNESLESSGAPEEKRLKLE